MFTRDHVWNMLSERNAPMAALARTVFDAANARLAAKQRERAEAGGLNVAEARATIARQPGVLTLAEARRMAA